MAEQEMQSLPTLTLMNAALVTEKLWGDPAPRHHTALILNGAWPSGLRRLLWEQEIGGSNPLAPTKNKKHSLDCLRLNLLFKNFYVKLTYPLKTNFIYGSSKSNL